MQEINQRVKLLRKHLNLNQKDFSKKLGIAQTSLSLIETGKNTLTEQNIRLICLTFSINEDWLRFGEGQIVNYKQKSPQKEAEMSYFFQSLSAPMQDAVLNFVKNIVEVEKLKNQVVV